ncbi:PREDICTED: uncharacterized protein LOC108693777 [Atta colombica]|uniref:uncharacterized protein LOC108693777 n=1 Tax=Atta colombica TaxID=520822 RepID=UPI00084CDB45|nr:PREDICTED: uncharacterized protein LOC108693777 [Atta colombica]
MLCFVLMPLMTESLLTLLIPLSTKKWNAQPLNLNALPSNINRRIRRRIDEVKNRKCLQIILSYPNLPKMQLQITSCECLTEKMFQRVIHEFLWTHQDLIIS